MTHDEMDAILADITYLDWTLEHFIESGIPFLRVAFYAEDNHNPGSEPVKQYGRKWRLSYYMTRSEVVTTAFKAVLTAMEHETREQFRYKGADIFSGHIDVDAMVAMMTKPGALDKRPDHR